MKKLITTFVLAVSVLVVNAQTTNLLDTSVNISTNTVDEPSRPSNSIELTLGGGGTVIDGESVFGLDFTLSINPIKVRPEVWIGIAQGLYWEPDFAGSTDFYVDWSQAILPSKLDDSLYINLGWSGGALYTSDEIYTWRTGPEASIQWYTHDNCFIFAGVNYDVWVSEGEKEFRYSFGLGILF
jgi:hypothetical protein